MFKAPYTVFLSGLDNPYDYLRVNSLDKAADLWAGFPLRDVVVLDDNAKKIPVSLLRSIAGA